MHFCNLDCIGAHGFSRILVVVLDNVFPLASLHNQISMRFVLQHWGQAYRQRRPIKFIALGDFYHRVFCSVQALRLETFCL
jgi:hypothetical protein